MKKFIVLFSTLLILSTVCLCVGCKTQHTHEYTQTVVAPTCTQRGYTEHKCACGESYNDNYVDALGHEWVVEEYYNDATCEKNGTEKVVCSREGCSETNIRERENSALGHDYEISYVWDGDKCTATAVCSRDSNHKIEETVTAKYVKDTDKTCTDNEKGHYLAEFSNVVVFADQQTEKNSVEIEGTKTGHMYGQTEYKLSVDFTKCTAKITCKNDGCTHYIDETVTATYEKDTAATCTDNETGRYKATFTSEWVENKNYVSGPIEIKDSASGHDYEIKYNWVDNQCTATAVCKNNSSHKVEENGTVTYEIDTPASHTNNAKGHYKATFKNTIFEVQTTAENFVVQEGSQLTSYIEFKTLKTNDAAISGEVESNITSFNFGDEIEIVGVAVFAVYKDENCSTKIDNTVTLAVGKNVFYVEQTVESPYKGENKKFTVTINREYPYYTVSFDTDGGTEISSQSVKHGECAEEPSDPAKVEYKFIGWYIGEEEFNFETKIYENKTITAKWQYAEYNVTCSVTVVDKDNNPIQNAELKIYRTDGTVEEKTGKTDANGVYNFSLEIKSEDVKLSSYSVCFVTVPYGFEQVSFTLDDSTSNKTVVDLKDVVGKSASVKFVLENIINNSFYETKNRITMEYKRYYSEGDTVTNGKDTTTVTFDGTSNYKYLTFKPYVAPSGSSDDAKYEQDKENNTVAAKGWYKISFETELSGICLKYFSGNPNYTYVDKNNVPMIDTIQASSGQKPADYDGNIIYYDGNYVKVEVTRDAVDAPFMLLVYSESAGNVTIKVEWLEDSRDIIRKTVTEVIDGKAETFSFEGITGELVDMPVNGYYELVLDADGYYHIGKVDGPYLMVQLNKANSRVGEQAITVLGSDEGAKRKYTITVVTDEGYTITKYDFENVLMGYVDDNKKTVKGYKSYANSDGVFPVNEQLKRYLEGASGSFAQQKTAASGWAWLLACMYYEPEGGLDLPGEGTEDKPYLLTTGGNTIKSTGLSFLEFTADEDAIYSFDCNNTMFSLKTEATMYTHNFGTGKGNVHYVVCSAGSSYRFTVQYPCTLTISKLDEIKATKDIVDNEDGSKTDNSTGVTETKPISTSYIMTSVFVQDDAQAPDGIYVTFNRMVGSGTYKFTLYGKNGEIMIKYNDTDGFVKYNDGEEVTISKNNPPTFLITTKPVDGKVQDGKYLLVIETV